MVKDYFGNDIKVGDVILLTTYSKLYKHKVLKITKEGNLKLSSYVNVGNFHYGYRINNNDLSQHNSFIYKQWLGDFIIIKDDAPLNENNLKSFKRLRDEQRKNK